ncbi:MAG: hypothetical protein H7Y07_07235 [Pyrinomonadaceae bacterium]|nr:hypothetical protein [Sphingobacteriaceae bacterium]
MTNPELLKILEKNPGKKTVLQLASTAATIPEMTKQLIDLTLLSEKEIAFRAAWILEYHLVSFPDRMLVNLQPFIQAYLLQTNLSCKRHYTKILMHYSHNGRSNILEGYNLTQIIETTFEWLINPATPVAVQVNCMDILYNLRAHANWVDEELRAQIAFLLKNGSAAMQSRGKKLIKRLSK